MQSPNSVNTIARHTPHRLLSSVSSSSSPSPTPSLSLSNSLSSAADHNFELGVELQHDSIVSRTSALAHTHAITVHDAHNTHGERTSSASLLNDLHALEKWVQSMQTLDHNELCQHKYAVKQMTAIMKQSAHRALLLPPDTRTSSAPATIKTSSVTAITAAVAVSANRLLESADKDSTLIRGVNTQIQTEKNTGGDKDKEEMRHISNDVHEEGTRRGGSDDDFTANQAVETGRGDADNDNTNNSGGRGGIHISGGSGDEKDEGGPESELGSSLLASMPLGFSAAALTAASSIADNIAAARKKVDVNPNGDVCDPDRLAWQSRATFDGHEWTSLDKEIDPSVIALDDISDLDNSDNSEEAEETEGEDESTQHEKAKSNCDVDKNDREMRRSIEQHKMLEESIGHTVSVAIRSEGAGQCHNFGDDVGSETSQGCRFGDTSMMFSLASSSSPALLATTLSSLDDMDDMDDDVARSNTGARAGADNTANNGDGIGHKTGGVGIDAVGSGVARVDKVEAGRTNVNDKDDERGIGKHDKCSGFADDSDINDDYLSGLWDSNEGGVGDGGIAKLENVNCTSIGSFSLPLHIATGSEDFGVAIGTRNVDVDYAAGNAAIGQSDDLRDVDLSDLWSDDNYSAMMTVHDTDNQHNNPAGTAASVVKNVNANTKKKESQTTSVANVVHEYADDDDINDDDLSGLWDDDDDVDKTNTISLVDDKDIIDNINDARGKGFMKNADDDKLKGNDEDDIDWGTDSEGEGADQDQSKALPSCSSSAPVLAPVAHSDLGARSSVDLHEFQVTAALHSSFLESERQHQEQGLGMVQAACQSSAFEKAFKDVIEAPVPLATLLAWSGDRDQNHHEGRSMDRVKMKEEENMRVE